MSNTNKSPEFERLIEREHGEGSDHTGAEGEGSCDAQYKPPRRPRERGDPYAVWEII